MRSFQNVFSKICIFQGIAPAIWVLFRALTNLNLNIFWGVFKMFPTSIAITSTLRVPPRTLAFTPGKSLRRFRKDNNYLEKFDTY